MGPEALASGLQSHGKQKAMTPQDNGHLSKNNVLDLVHSSHPSWD